MTSHIDHVGSQRHTKGVLSESVSRQHGHILYRCRKETHQCRIILEAKNIKSAAVNGCPDWFRVSSGILDHIIVLSRVESFLSHLAWEDIADVRRYERRVFFVADVDYRVISVPCGSIAWIMSVCSQGKLIQERVTLFTPIRCNGISPAIFLVMEADLCRASVWMGEPEDGPHRLVIVVAQMSKLNSEASNSRFKSLLLLKSWVMTGQEHPEKIIESVYLVEGTDTGVTVD